MQTYWAKKTLTPNLCLCLQTSSNLSSHFQVSVEEGKQLAREFQCPFFETSAAFRYYIDEVFAALVRQIRQHEAEMVRGSERKTRRSHSFWSRLKAPFHKKQQSEHWERGACWDTLAFHMMVLSPTAVLVPALSDGLRTVFIVPIWLFAMMHS